MRQVVLLSGGIDSLVCAEMARRAGQLAGCVFVDYGHPSQQIESHHGFIYCKKYGYRMRVFHAFHLNLGDMKSGQGARVVPARNAVLLSLAANHAGTDEAVTIGVNAGDATDYLDCRADFIAAMQTALGIPVLAPLLHMTKAEVIAKARTLGLSPDDAWSCYGPGPFTCGRCPSCVQSEEAWAMRDGEVWRTSCCNKTGREFEANGHDKGCSR